jgi:hypothetical protein
VIASPFRLPFWQRSSGQFLQGGSRNGEAITVGRESFPHALDQFLILGTFGLRFDANRARIVLNPE